MPGNKNDSCILKKASREGIQGGLQAKTSIHTKMVHLRSPDNLNRESYIMHRKSSTDANSSRHQWQGACPVLERQNTLWRGTAGPSTRHTNRSLVHRTVASCQAGVAKAENQNAIPEASSTKPIGETSDDYRNGRGHSCCATPDTRHQGRQKSLRISSRMRACRDSKGLGCMFGGRSIALLGQPRMFEHQCCGRALRGVGLQAAGQDLEDGRATG